MKIKKTENGNVLTISLAGRLDTGTAPELEKEINSSLDNIEELYLDFEGLDYVSSAGLRVLLAAQKIMNRKGRMILQNVNDDIMEVFEMTGFVDILTIE